MATLVQVSAAGVTRWHQFPQPFLYYNTITHRQMLTSLSRSGWLHSYRSRQLVWLADISFPSRSLASAGPSSQMALNCRTLLASLNTWLARSLSLNDWTAIILQICFLLQCRSLTSFTNVINTKCQYELVTMTIIHANHKWHLLCIPRNACVTCKT